MRSGLRSTGEYVTQYVNFNPIVLHTIASTPRLKRAGRAYVSFKSYIHGGLTLLSAIARSSLRSGSTYDSSLSIVTLSGPVVIASILVLQAAKHSLHRARFPGLTISMPSMPWHITMAHHRSCFHPSPKSPPTAARTSIHGGFHFVLFRRCNNPCWPSFSLNSGE